MLQNPSKNRTISFSGGFMRTTKQQLGRKIKEARKARGLSQEQLAEKIDIESKHVSRIEVGASYPSLDRLEKIALALNVSIKDLFDFAASPVQATAREAAKRKTLTKNIEKMLKKSDDKTLATICKIIQSLAD
jgi:transcriptional regulator with XRE-family HTH domain